MSNTASDAHQYRNSELVFVLLRPFLLLRQAQRVPGSLARRFAQFIDSTYAVPGRPRYSSGLLFWALAAPINRVRHVAGRPVARNVPPSQKGQNWIFALE